MKSTLLILNLFSFLFSLAQSNNNYQKNWATYFGGQGTRIVNSVIDSNDNIIVAGLIIGGSVNALQDQFYYNQFATTTNPAYLYNSTIVSPSGSNSNQSIIAKFSPNGNLLESIYLPIEIIMIKINGNDEILISGTSTQTNIGTAGVWMSSPLPALNNEPTKAIIAKLNVNFSINWLTYLPTTIFGIFTLDSLGNIYASSYTNINNSITTNGTFQPNFITEIDSNTGQNYNNGYLFKLNNQGQMQWATYCGLTIPQAISYDNDQLLVSFARQETTLAAYDGYYYTSGAYQQTPSTQIISKFNATTAQRIYSTYLGNSNLSITHIVSQDGYTYLLGDVSGSAFVDTNLVSSNAFQNTFNGIQDMYLGKFNSNLVPIWGTYIGGNDYEESSIQSNFTLNNNSLYFSGLSYSNGFINNINSYQLNNQGNGDLFMMKFSENGLPIWGSFFGGNKAEEYGSIVPVNDDIFYMVGETYSQNNISTSGSFQPNMSINPNHNSFVLGNGFVTKFNPLGLATENFSFSELNIYPNPSNGFFVIKSSNLLEGISYLNLYNTLGQKIITREIDLTSDQYIELEYLESGVYYLDIENKNLKKNLKKKLIIN
ncbi:T9SS type A sorting domain-containing protein [Flavobacterium sp.]|uniref:T9SS type A sorting domain-containing protein n=1 Tax=Flavobacterium sp. TaxID=239 RepID=UPI0038FCE128